MKISIVPIALLTLVACSTIRPPNLEADAWRQVNNINDEGQYDSNKISSRFNGKPCITADGETHDELCKAYSFADFYRQNYIELSSGSYTVGSGLDAMGLLAGLTGVTAVAFGWHQDAITSSALTLAAVLGAKSYTQPVQRSDLYLEGAQRMQCIINTAPRILNGSISYVELENTSDDLERSIDSLMDISKKEIALAKEFKPNSNSGLTDKDVQNHIDSFMDIRSNAEELRIEMARDLSLITGMPDLIIVSVKEAELKFTQRFVSSAPDFNQSLSVIQTVITQHALNQQKKERLDSLFPKMGLLPIKSENNNRNEKEIAFYKIVDATRDLNSKHQSLVAMIVNYTDVAAALKLCSTI